MEKEFVTYELALRMKALGFDEPCFGYYGESQELIWKSGYAPWVNSERSLVDMNFMSAPTWQSAFAWFKEEHNLHSGLVPYYDYFYYVIKDLKSDNEYKSDDLIEISYEELQPKLLDKLCEIVELKQK